MNNKIIEVLKNIYKKFEKENIFWVLSGSVSLAIQGVDVQPQDDIDILTDENGSKKIYILLNEYCIQEPVYSTTNKYQSYFGVYKINNIQVEVMGDFQYKLKNGNWSEKNHLHTVHIVEYEKMKLPVLELYQELQEYKNLNRLDKQEKIEKFLKSINSL